MTDRFEALRRLERIKHAVFEGQPAEPIDAVEFVAGIECFLARDCPTLEVALGLAAGPGERDVRTAQQLATRDHHVRQAVAVYRQRGETNPCAALARDLARYRAIGWRTDRLKPGAPHDGRAALLFAILTAHDASLSERRIAMIARETS